MTAQTTKIAEADKVIKHYMLSSLGVGLVPYPVVDMALLISLQLKMLHSLATVYDTKFSEELGKKVVTTCLGSIVPVSLSVNLTQLLRFIPVYGWLIQGVSTSAFASAFTYAIGKLFVLHFESGNTFLTLDPQQVKDYFATQFEQGKVEINKSFVGVKP